MLRNNPVRVALVVALGAGPMLRALPATAGSTTTTTTTTSRSLSTAGLQSFNLGGGVVVYTNAPQGVLGFSWNTGSSSGSIATLPGVSGGSGISIGN